MAEPKGLVLVSMAGYLCPHLCRNSALMWTLRSSDRACHLWFLVGVSVRIFKTKWFTRFAAKEGVDDAKLAETVQNIESGLIDADYGGGLVKQRIARDGGGKSGWISERRCIPIENPKHFPVCLPKKRSRKPYSRRKKRVQKSGGSLSGNDRRKPKKRHR